jgi:type IV pilus assembly protein PilQ
LHAACRLLLLLLLPPAAWPADFSHSITEMGFVQSPGGGLSLSLKMEGGAVEPRTFTIDDPPRIVLDFPDTDHRLSRPRRHVGIGMVRNLRLLQTPQRARLVINLLESVPYTTEIRGGQVLINLGASTTAATPSSELAHQPSITNIDFQRGDANEARVVVTLSDPGILADLNQQGSTVLVDFLDTYLPEELQQRLDVTDFATPVQSVDSFTQGNNTRLEIALQGPYEHLAYQAGDQYTIEFKRPAADKKEEQAAAGTKTYTGEPLSLNFQNIETRAVLQILADFTGLNIVVSDTVEGSITLRLTNVPWDQALDIILKTRGLAMRRTGNVILVAPSEEITARERLELESKQQIAELMPLRSEHFKLKYAKASDLGVLFGLGEGGGDGGDGGDDGSGGGNTDTLLSERGSAILDKRTNSLLIKDTEETLQEIRQIIAKLDVPVRQVLIESRIVTADDDFARALGMRFGYSKYTLHNSDSGLFSVIGGGGTGGSSNGAGTYIYSVTDNGTTAEGLMVNLPASSSIGGITLPAAGSFIFNLGRLGQRMLQLELQAMEQDGRGEVISSPRVVTANQQEAVIKQGVQIPYEESTSSGATSVEFQEANLSLTVTPQITPDDRVIMDLEVTKDEPSALSTGAIGITTNQVKTQVLVDDGDTIVLGGIYERQRSETVNKVPLLGDIPVFGRLFRNESKYDIKNELLIFVTPKILGTERQAP